MEPAVSRFIAARAAARKLSSFYLCVLLLSPNVRKFPVIPSQTDPITVLVVDDEAPARQRIIDLLRKESIVGTILEANDGLQAIDSIEQYRPGLLFLDVQMPELDGLGVMDALMKAVGSDAMPLTVFVTAYDQHAVRAFEANALDYLLKPFSDERYESTMARVRSRLEDRNLSEFGMKLARMMSDVSAPAAPRRWLDRLVVKSAGATRFLRVTDIEWIEAAGAYVSLHLRPAAGGGELLYRSSLMELAAKLDPARFIRVHRSTIVNLEEIQQLEPISHGEFDVLLKSGARTRISRSFRSHLEERLQQSL
jgi:two-component system LytT family response regulator